MSTGSVAMSDCVFTRFRVKLTLSDVHNIKGDKVGMRAGQVRDEIQQFLDACAHLDPTVALVPWSAKDKDTADRLPRPSQSRIPTHPDLASKYFHSINFYSSQQDLYFYMRLRHEVTAGVLLNNVDRSFRLSLWVASLQLAEKPVKGGFFVYSHRAFSTSPSLISSIKRTIEQMVDKTVELSCFWGAVNMFKIGLQGPYALQIEVDESDYDILKRSLTLIYNKNKAYPLGVPMVYVPPVNKCLDEDLLRHACESQLKFQSMVSAFEFRCFVTTDLSRQVQLQPDKGQASTLGDFLRKTISFEATSVFHSVIECSDSSGGSYVHALVMPSAKKLKVAKTIFKSPVAVFRYFLEESLIPRLFDTISILQGQSDVYDPESGTVTNKDESQTWEALKSFCQVDMQMVIDNNNEGSQQGNGDAASYASNFSFNPGSVRTNSAWSKRARFSPHQQVPGASRGAYGEGS